MVVSFDGFSLVNPESCEGDMFLLIGLWFERLDSSIISGSLVCP